MRFFTRLLLLSLSRGLTLSVENLLNILGAPESGHPHTFLISRQKLSLDDDGVVVFSLDGLISFVGDRRVRSNHSILQSPLVPSPSCCVYPVHVKPVSRFAQLY